MLPLIHFSALMSTPIILDAPLARAPSTTCIGCKIVIIIYLAAGAYYVIALFPKSTNNCLKGKIVFNLINLAMEIHTLY